MPQISHCFSVYTMFRKLSAAVLAIVAASGTISAQYNTGDWKIHTIFASDQVNVVATDFGVFFVSDDCLFSYDTETATITAYSQREMLNDTQVTDAFYNRDANYLLVTYSSSNIDVIEQDGTVTNFSDIADMAIPCSKEINDVTFSGEDAYIATDFGFVVIDWSARRMSESNLYYESVNSVAKVGDDIWLNDTDGNFLYAGSDSSHSSLSCFSTGAAEYGQGTFMPVSSTTFLFKGSSLTMRLVTVADDHSLSFSTLTSSTVGRLQTSATGFVAQISTTTLVILDQTGEVTATITLPSEMQSSLFSSNAENVLWELSSSGVRQIALSGTDLTAEGDYYLPTTSTVQKVGYLLYNEDQDKLYVTSLSVGLLSSSYGQRGYINTLQNGIWTDVSPDSVYHINRSYNYVDDILSPFFDPSDSNTYYFGSWFDGVYKITDGEQAMKYDWSNSPLVAYGKYCIVPAVQLDVNHNLWVVEQASSGPVICVLPYAKQSLSYSELTSDDWIVPDLTLPSDADFRMSLLITQKTDIKIFTMGKYGTPLYLYDDGGDPSSDNIVMAKFNTFTDQDENTYSWLYHYCLFEDSDGLVWIGSDEGVVAFNPTDAFDSENFRVTRPLATLEDGSTEYLLDGKSVVSIAADEDGNKWFATLEGGVYQTNSDGTTVLNHFTADNSYLSTDEIISVGCKPDGSAAYFGTTNGLIEYDPNSSSSESDFSQVTVSPTRVTADYTGFVVIEHLVSDAYLTITDTKGNTVASLQADGGVAQWSLCDDQGDRVPTGKYYIYGSTDVSSKGELIGYVNAMR